MTPDELATNLGTLAKSGTSDFLSKVEKDAGDAGNLIGQFGVGFYSAFLVSDRVYVASLPHPSKENPNPVQTVFSSSAEDSNFDIYPDPRGNTLGRGTEITLILKEDALEYLDGDKLRELVAKHSAFATTYPIYLHTYKTVEVPDDTTPVETEPLAEPTSPATETSDADEPKATTDDEPKATTDDEEGTVEEEAEVEEEEKPEPIIPMKNVTTEEWVHLNDQPPLWARDAKNVTKEEYDLFFRSTFKDPNNPLALHHFKGDAGPISFKAILFIPPDLDKEFWQSAKIVAGGIKLMVKRVFITSDFGEASLPKWASWIRAIVDADDLPLNVSRETLQSTRFLKQIRQVVMNRALSLFARIAEEDEKLFKKIVKMYGGTFKLGAMENSKERAKLVSLVRWDTNLRNFTSLDQYVTNKKQGQTQIFFVAGTNTKPEVLAKSVFIEKLHARGYEVLLAHDPMDEMLLTNLRSWKGMQIQDVAKKGLVFGDEDSTAASEKVDHDEQEEKYQPLIKYLKVQAAYAVKEVTISHRLVTSAVAIVADQWGYSANMEKLMSAQNGPNSPDSAIMAEWAKKQRTLEINPRSPLIQGLLKKVQLLDEVDVEAGEERDPELEREIQEAVSILVDGALVRSGFELEDSNTFFTRIDRVLRRSLGVAEEAETDATVTPAPPVDESASSLVEEKEDFAASLDTDESIPEQEPPSFESQINFDNEQPFVVGEDAPTIKIEDEVKHDEL